MLLICTTTYLTVYALWMDYVFDFAEHLYDQMSKTQTWKESLVDYVFWGTIVSGLMMPLPYLDLVWLKVCPHFAAIFVVMVVRCFGAHINWLLVNLARPRGKGVSNIFFLWPLYNLIKARPLIHGTIFRLLPIPHHFKVIMLGITEISYTNWIKTSLIASIF